MRRIAMLMALGGVLVAGSSAARAATVVASGAVDWTALTRFNAHSAEVVFVDAYNGGRLVAPLTIIGGHQAKYTVTLNPDTFYIASAIIADCSAGPETCGTATVGGTHIRFGVTFVQTLDDGAPLAIDLIADASLNPVAICGSVTVDSGTFVKLFTTTSQDTPDVDFSAGVFSTALVNAPTSSYCVAAAEFSFTFLDTTLTIAQNQLPGCPSPLDVQRRDFLVTANDPITADIHVVVPPPPGRITGAFAVTGFAADSSSVSGFNSAPTIGDCAGLSSFTAFGGPGPVSFDVSPALAGTWNLFASANKFSNSADGLFQIFRTTAATRGSGLFTVDVAAGNPVVPALSYTAATVSGSVSTDARRWGAPSAVLNAFPAFDAATSAIGVTGANWINTNVVILPMRVSESYDLYLDPRGTNWAVRLADGIGYQYVFSTPSVAAFAGYNGVGALPNVGGHSPTDIAGSLGVVVGNVTAGGHIPLDMPKLDFRVASVTLNPAPSGSFLFWFASQGRYPLPGGVLGVLGPLLQSFSQETGAPAVGRAMLPPGIYEGSTTTSDADFNSFTENRTFDLEPDDDLTADFGAPMLLAVRPKPGAAGGATTVTGKVVSSADPAATAFHVLVNGVPATVRADGSFAAGAVVGTTALTIVASDNLGRTTTLKRYFTTMTGLFAPAAGADLVSQGQDVNAITSFVFAPPMASTPFHAPQTIPLRLAGALGSVALTSANAAAPHVVGLLRVAPGVLPPTTIALTGQTVFQNTDGNWLYNLRTTGLQAGTYVVQIQFWDGRILEAAFVLS